MSGAHSLGLGLLLYNYLPLSNVFFKGFSLLDKPPLRSAGKKPSPSPSGGSAAIEQKALALAQNITWSGEGIHLKNSLLWFDSLSCPGITFVSSAIFFNKQPDSEYFCTEETSQILGLFGKSTKSLACQFNRPFSIGDLKLELLPSGNVLGGASLFVETPQGRILYAPYLQTKHIPLVRRFQLKKAEVLVIGAFQPSEKIAPSRKKERQKLFESVQNILLQGSSPVVVCLPFATAQELTKNFNDEGFKVAVDYKIHAINKAYEQHGSQLGSYTLYSPRIKKQKVIIVSPAVWINGIRKGTFNLEKSFFIDDAMHPVSKSIDIKAVAKTFNISSACSSSEFNDIVAAVQPKTVVVFGPYAKMLANELKEGKFKVKILFKNDQPTLF